MQRAAATSAPSLTVLLPVYNAAEYVLEAAQSVLEQHGVDLELLCIDDGSTDNSLDLLRTLHDERVRIEQNPSNLGLIATLNRGFELARGRYIARMDADDICMPGRLERQAAFLEANQDVGVCGMWIRTFGAGQESIMRFPTDPENVRARLFAYNPLAHPTVVLRRSLFDRHGLRYAPEASHAEDLDLWMRAAEHFALANLPQVGLRYRQHPGQVTSRHAPEQAATLRRLRLRQLERLLPGATKPQKDLHLAVLDLDRPLQRPELEAAAPWLETLRRANVSARVYSAPAFDAFLAERWLNACHRLQPAGPAMWKIYSSSALARSGPESLKLLAKGLLGAVRG